MKELKLEIEELEERIAHIVDPFLAGLGVFLPSEGGGGQAVANGGIDPPGAENNGVNNPAGVGAPVPNNNPGVGPG